MGSVQQALRDLAMAGIVCGLCWSCGTDPGSATADSDPDAIWLQDVPQQDPGMSDGRAEDGASSGTAIGRRPPDSDPVEACGGRPRADLITEPQEAFNPLGLLRGTKEPCQIPAYRGIASAGMELAAQLDSFDPLDRLDLVRFEARAATSGFAEEAQRVSDASGVAVMSWTASYTGEYVLAVDAADPLAQGDFQLAVRCLAGCDRRMTRFPIVLLHGMGGTDNYLGILDYFFGVEQAMEEAGFDVRITVVDPLAHSQIRARQLIPQLEEILADTGARRLNLIGHSQGGLDGRVLLSELDFGERIASFTSIATPHHGSPIADLVVGLLASNKITEELAEAVVDTFARLFGNPEPRLADQLRELTREYMEEVFNPTHPDDPRVAYYSWAGRTCALIEVECQEEWNGEVVIPFLVPTYWANVLLGAEENDGLVPVESAIWGEFLGVLPADHYDQVGQLADTSNPSFDHRAFFVAEGQRLFESGF